MKSLFLSPFLLLAAFLGVAAQQPTSTPPPVDDQVVKINTNLIQIDVLFLIKAARSLPGSNLRILSFLKTARPKRSQVSHSYLNWSAAQHSATPARPEPDSPEVRTSS